MRGLCYTKAKQEKGNESLMQLSDAIKIARQKAFLSQDAFASELKVAISTINRWENGKSKPNLNAMKEIKSFCERYNLPYSDIETEWFNTELSDKE